MQFVSSLTNIKLAGTQHPKFRFGRFTLVNDTIANAKIENVGYNADLSLATNFSFAGKKKIVAVNDIYSDYSGYNKKFVDEDGVFDPGACYAEFARNGLDKRLFKEETLSILRRQTNRDSHESFILNMLISWQKAVLYRDSNGDDYMFEVKTKSFKNAHTEVPIDGGYGEHTYEVELDYPVSSDALEAAAWVLRDKDNFWKKPFVLYYNSGGSGQAEFYLSHVMGRTKTSILNFDIPLPGVDTRDLLLQPVNGEAYVPVDFASVPFDQPNILWAWIMDYVKLNRLEQAFAACLEVLGSLGPQPEYSSTEGTVWKSATVNVSVATFSPTRARIPIVLDGEAYTPHASAVEFTSGEGNLPGKYIVASAISNYYMWYGLYAILHNVARERDEWRTVFGSLQDELAVLYTPAMRAACISSITGKEYSSFMNNGMAIYVDVKPLADITEIKEYHILDGRDDTGIPINALFAPVSGSLILGTLSGELDVVQHLKSVQQFKSRGLEGVYLFEELLPIAQLYRIFGHDTYMYDERKQVEELTWANSRECVIEPASIEFDYRNSRKTRITRTEVRQGRNHVLPNANFMFSTSGYSLVLHKPTITVKEYGTRTVPIQSYANTNRKRKEVKYMIKAPITFSAITFLAKKLPSVSNQIFPRPPVSLAPMKPEGKPDPIMVSEESVSTATDDLNANTAD